MPAVASSAHCLLSLHHPLSSIQCRQAQVSGFSQFATQIASYPHSHWQEKVSASQTITVPLDFHADSDVGANLLSALGAFLTAGHPRKLPNRQVR